jgi:putative transcriptional regulator
MSNDTKTTNRFLSGNFLVATPYLHESPYQRSVVLVMRHDSQGALGFVMHDQLKSSLVDLEKYFDSTFQRGGQPAGEFPGIQMFSAIVRWSAGKLESEIDQGIWIATPARLDVALGCDNLWVSLLRQIGRDVLSDGLGIKSFPADPRSN